MLLAALLALSLAPQQPAGADARHVRGVTVSCQTWGWEWGTDGFAEELDRLRALGVNWVAIHPYGSIRADGTVEARRIDPAQPPEWIARPIREAHARGMSILVIPHVAYWGSPWSWRGAIEFDAPEKLERFFATYERWIVSVASIAREADGFCVGNELEKLVASEHRWRAVIAAVRAVTPARLTWAANWSGYRDVRFWDALDAIGVQAYFPLCEREDPPAEVLRQAWKPILAELRAFHEQVGKPVVFTELGYRAALDCAREPWTYREERGELRERAEAIQARCLEVALSEIEPEREWLRGAFLWKWFVASEGHEGRSNFTVDREDMRAVLRSSWGAGR
jgi:hypothetical protein